MTKVNSSKPILTADPKLDFPHRPPTAKKVPYRIETHGDARVDNYFWLREKTNKDVISLLENENAYTEAVLSTTGDLRERLFSELKDRIKEDDSDVPVKLDDTYYYSRMVPGQQYAVHCRKRMSLDAPEEILLDENELAKGGSYFSLGFMEVSPRQDWLAYSIDTDGSEKYTIYFKNLKTGRLSPESIPGASHSLEWAEDNQTVFYTLLDEHERPDRLLRHRVGENPVQDQLIHKELDTQLFVSCSKSRSRKFIFLVLSGKITSEVHYVDAHRPQDSFRVIEPRRKGVLYSVEHHGNRFFIVTDDTVQNFRLVEAPVEAPSSTNWKELRAGNPELFIEGVDAFEKHLVLYERAGGLQQIRVIDLEDSSHHLISFPEPTYYLSPHSNPEFKTETLRFSYTSLVTPATVIDYDMRSRSQEVKKVQEIPSGYDPTLYKSEWVYATSPDGVRIPISIVYRLDKNGEFTKDGSHPLYLYGYGSYGLNVRPAFSTSRLSLLDRGFVFAMAHIRGGSEMGRQWYQDGKFLKKKNTFLDFIAAAEHLIEQGYTKKSEIAIAGGSAGGMLVGAALNMRPELFKAAVAHVPFVDVINTMLDSTLPLTTIEYDEWGNPNDLEYYRYMKSYSPYDNVEPKAYPHILVTSGLNDPRVTYWEPAKWVAKLRELKTDSNLLLQYINMTAGHGGASGRYDSLREIALEYAFLLLVFGKT